MRTRLTKLWAAMLPALIFIMANAEPLLAQDKKKAPEKVGVFEMFFLAGRDPFGMVITWLLILMSFVAMALIIKFLMDNSASQIMPVDSVVAYEQLLQEKRFREAIERAQADETAFGQIIGAALSEAGNGYGAMARAVEEETDRISSKRARSVEWLNVIGAVGPMIGLFGTVYGMIVAFSKLVEAGGRPNPADLAGGISTALVTTFWGLIVGIPAVAGGAIIKNKIDGLMLETMVQAEGLIRQFQPSSRKKSSSSSAKRPA